MIGLGLYDENGRFLESLYENEMDALNSYDGHDRLTPNCMVKSTSLYNGRYGISAYVRPKNSDIKTKVRTSGGKTDTYYFTFNDGDSNEEEKEEPVIPDVNSTVWKQDFEGMGLPQNYELETIVGDGAWEVRRIMNSYDTPDNPYPANGKGYAVLTYSNISFGNKRNVCQLKTDDISLESEHQYVLTFQCRKFSSQPIEDSSLLSVFYREKGSDDWSLIQESTIISQESWQIISFNLPTKTSHFELAFQGSVGIGSSLFLDNIRISNGDKTMIQQPNAGTNPISYYDMSGRYINQPTKGIYVICNSKGERKKIYVR